MQHDLVRMSQLHFNLIGRLNSSVIFDCFPSLYTHTHTAQARIFDISFIYFLFSFSSFLSLFFFFEKKSCIIFTSMPEANQKRKLLK